MTKTISDVVKLKKCLGHLRSAKCVNSFVCSKTMGPIVSPDRIFGGVATFPLYMHFAYFVLKFRFSQDGLPLGHRSIFNALERANYMDVLSGRFLGRGEGTSVEILSKFRPCVKILFFQK